MVLLGYFKKRASTSPGGSSTKVVVLPDQNGPISKEIPFLQIREANEEVSKVLEAAGKCKPYLKVPDNKKAVIAKYAAEHGIVSAIAHFAPDFPQNALKESMVHGWKNHYLEELNQKRQNGKELSVSKLPFAKMERLLTLSASLDDQVKA